MAKIRPITIDELERLGIDENNNLYWDSKPVVIKEKIELQWWVNLSAVTGAASGVILAVIEILRYCAGK